MSEIADKALEDLSTCERDMEVLTGLRACIKLLDIVCECMQTVTIQIQTFTEKNS